MTSKMTSKARNKRITQRKARRVLKAVPEFVTKVTGKKLNGWDYKDGLHYSEIKGNP